ncbi:putative toxin-antitoxin system toxin component, PIN family [candidate division WOR-1 bacterium RIFOXYB2_FULL_42_35]|uniref:Putative toxin-antitoxin system toxin component, PIN family n=1 Tax=candidate division WOR-1 bacterium RIFOXYC2_FULL_41_25 TaxID=1802586 RepID=A0A1F4TJW6_UNCSA|nr:MAG: putative toxin-antitoxin system toxin component, PIN family [candidate division WOR-1 bacterium RIFOXYA2_FULL_41_14]OGC23463.1 MAG: putative toxin-antitoxin system toxin component, PIN family [candidate division WOR-1 bacterium RIFOXYB2_FULL_42_35]OGC32986.1 MAG: putative toxin-antitoxin system toxin component, PIN family [candidate division WOR-1 bacterium RIFOXYC2_FULL_41_25]
MSSEKNKLRVVLDTNIYISALLFGGLPAELVELARDKKLQLLTSSAILLELARILQTKFKFKRTMVLNVVAEIKRLAEIVNPEIKIDIIKSDPADNKIIECAVIGRADYIVTGDKKHLRPLNHYQNIIIRLPREFIKEAIF